jgi:hypothetical protein
MHADSGVGHPDYITLITFTAALVAIPHHISLLCFLFSHEKEKLEIITGMM